MNVFRAGSGIHYLCFLLLSLFFSSCRKDNPKPDYPIGSNENINSWVLDSMKVFYYWNKSLPQKPDFSLTPLIFFSGIKNASDRFSLLIDPAKPLTYNPSLVAALGIDFVSLEISGNTQSIITLVIPGSEAEQAGIKRGDKLTSLNGTTLSSSNAATLINQSIAQGRISLTIEGRTDNIAYNSSYPADRPVYLSKVIEANGKKIAYIFFNSFANRAIADLKSAFSSFRSGQATELIIDMRYNGGGDVGIAALLTALVAPVQAAYIFGEYRGNSSIGTQRNSFSKELSRISQSTDQLTGYRLPLSRVFILTGRHTASAAELVANNLSPYISVVRIGEQTIGKDMASFDIKDMRNPKQVTGWIIHPMVYKLYNANGAGDYASGLPPDQLVNELQSLPLKPFGDTEDPLIKAALSTITGIKAPASRIANIVTPSVKLYDSREAVDKQSGVVTIKRW